MKPTDTRNPVHEICGCKPSFSAKDLETVHESSSIPEDASVIHHIFYSQIKVEELLKKQLTGKSILHVAAYHGNLQLCKQLIGITPVNQADQFGNTPLHLASMNSHEEVAELLIKSGVVDINAKNKLGRTPIHYAAQSNSPKILELLIRNQFSIFMPDSNGDTPLHLACRSNLVKNVTLMAPFYANTEFVDLFNFHGFTALGEVVSFESKQTSDLELASIVLSMGADPYISDPVNNLSPITIAAFAGKHELVHLLMTRNVQSRFDPNIIGGINRMPLLHILSMNGNVPCLKSLLAAHQGRADLELIDGNGRTALAVSAAYNQFECLRMLKDNGARVDCLTQDGNMDSVFHLFCSTIPVPSDLVGEALLSLLDSSGLHTAPFFSLNSRGLSCLHVAIESAILQQSGVSFLQLFLSLVERMTQTYTHVNFSRYFEHFPKVYHRVKGYVVHLKNSMEGEQYSPVADEVAINDGLLPSERTGNQIVSLARLLVNLPTSDGRTPAHYAIDCCHEVMSPLHARPSVSSLVAQGATIQILEVLQDFGAFLNLRDKDGKLARDYCKNKLIVCERWLSRNQPDTSAAELCTIC